MKNITKGFLIILLLLTLLTGTAHALVYGADNYMKNLSLLRGGGNQDPLYRFMVEVESVLFPAVGTGSIYYVNSGVTTEGDGTSWTNAKDKLQEGIDLCTDNRGDFVFVADGHAEDIATGTALDLDCPGMTIRGFGSGDEMPEISLTAQASKVGVSAPDVTVYNMRFLGEFATGSTYGFDVAATGDGLRVLGCQFRENSSNEELLIMFNVTAAANRLVIVGNSFIGATGGTDSSAIVLEGASNETVISGNYINGDWSDYVIKASGATSVQMLIKNNTIHNFDVGHGYTMAFEAASTGDIINNKCYGNGADFAIVGDAMFVSPDNICIQTEDGETINYDTLLRDILEDTGTSLVASIAALDDTGYTGECSTNTTTTQAICATLAGFGDDYFNTGWSLVWIYNDSSAGTYEGETIDITDYESSTGTFTLNVAASEAITASDEIYVRRIEELNLNDPTILGCAGTIRYVNSGTSGDGSGLTMENAYATIALAEAACSAGDVVYIADGHDEEVVTGDSTTLNVANTSFIGMGEGDARPLITITDDGTLLTLDNAGITVKKIRFQSGVTACDIAIRVEDAAIGCTIEDCAFIDGEASTTDEFVDVISVDQSASYLTVKNCTYYSLDATGHTNSFIDLGETTIDGTRVEGCTIFGMFAEAPIWGGAAAVPVNLTIIGNVISNTTTTQHCIEFTGAATGVCANNVLYSDSYNTMLDPGSLKCINNLGTDAINQQAIQIPLSAETSDITAVADGSDLERLEFLQDKSDDILASMGIDSATAANIFYVDSVAANTGTGLSWADSEDTLKAAVDDATDDTAAIIFVAANHTEDFGASIAMNCPGITVFGLGVGESRPKFTFTATGSVLTHTVADIKYKNLIFISGTADSNVGITLGATSDGMIVEDCEFRSTAAHEFVSCITFASATDDVRITRCKFDNSTAGVGAATGAITNIAGVTDNMIIEDCDFYGAWTAAAIVSDDADTNVIVRNNTVQNTSTGIHAIEFSAAALGTLSNNLCYADTYGTVIDPGSLKCFGNKEVSTTDSAGIDFPLVAGKTYALSVSVEEGDNDIFQVAGGSILITSFTGLITETVGGGAEVTTIIFDGTDDFEFSTGVDTTGWVRGSRIIFSAANPAVLSQLALTTSGSGLPMYPWFCPIGMIEQTDDGDTNQDGIWTWSMTFIPLAEGVTVIPQ